MNNPIVRTDNRAWPWVFARNAVYPLAGYDNALSADLYGKDGQHFARIHWGHLHIYPGYAFDGCTCAVDFQRALPGCAVHDALLQILDAHPGLYPEQLAHDQLKHTHKAHRFALAWLYHCAVSGWPRKLYKLWTSQSQ